ncbi:helix-turn-helix domain-containing protein [Frigidibacter sp. ROC022]|uniref:helix-turn-helix domain-containing protein n=1 Tax=Frigidibacter sp. ROC022 TaxID=2971796 RepID=UPI00215A49AF|nr:helix-turn-helix domain-containing protein [Frigidibacter sp. ROC022]MCR8725398.1 hypothetical protein [Frigidibacter sp. ROC022]
MADATGIRHLARILFLVAEHPGIRLGEICARGGLARTGTIEILGKLERAGFLRRLAGGRCLLAPKAFALGLAPLGLARIAERAEAVLLWLRQETGATVSLRAATEQAGPTEILRLPPQHQRVKHQIEAEVQLPEKAGACWITLGWSRQPRIEAFAYARGCLESACRALGDGPADTEPGNA